MSIKDKNINNPSLKKVRKLTEKAIKLIPNKVPSEEVGDSLISLVSLTLLRLMGILHVEPVRGNKVIDSALFSTEDYVLIVMPNEGTTVAELHEYLKSKHDDDVDLSEKDKQRVKLKIVDNKKD